MAAKPPPALLSAAFVYVWKGGTIPPLSPLYSGPYRVLTSGPKVFRLQVTGVTGYRGDRGGDRYAALLISLSLSPHTLPCDILDSIKAAVKLEGTFL
jgi:hypothetical protein